MFGLLFLTSVVFICIWWFLTKNFDYWKKRNVAFKKPHILVGNLGPTILKKRSLGELILDIYREFPTEPYVGIFLSGNPCLIVRDYELVKNILYKDGDHFAKRMLQFDENTEPLAFYSLFALTSSRWKHARSGLTRGFTSTKLKQNVIDMLPVANELQQRITRDAQKGVIAEEISMAFTVDTITRVLFGLQGNAIVNPNDPLLRLTTEMYKTDTKSVIAKFALFAAPQIYSLFRMKAFPVESMDNLRKITWDVMDTMEKVGAEGKNFISLLQELRKRDTTSTENKPFNFDGDELVAQVFAFLVAGTDTLSAAMTYSLYELAKHQDYQERLRKEVQEFLPEGFETINYDKLSSMKLLNMIVMETLRLHPAFPFVDRTCTKAYTLPGTNYTIDKGVFLFVPMWGLHLDKKYWERADEFYPEHFEDMEAVASKPYMPFSEGPRTCIGMRFALLEMSVFLASIVSRWRWTLNEDSAEPRCNPLTYTNMPDQPTKLKFVAV